MFTVIFELWCLRGYPRWTSPDLTWPLNTPKSLISFDKIWILYLVSGIWLEVCLVKISCLRTFQLWFPTCINKWPFNLFQINQGHLFYEGYYLHANYGIVQCLPFLRYGMLSSLYWILSFTSVWWNADELVT